MPRTRFQPTEENRRQVKQLAGLGLRQEQICERIGLRSAKTLRRYFSKELSLGIAESSANVLQTSFKLASSRKDPAATGASPPFTPGLDAAGTRLDTGERVLVTGAPGAYADLIALDRDLHLITCWVDGEECNNAAN